MVKQTRNGKEAKKKRICIIGAGGSGIAAGKACLEQKHDFVIYEMHTDFGGLWRYRDEDINGLGSVAAATIINSSKEMSAFTDFPPREDYPNYMHNTKMIQYIEEYAKHAGSLPYIKYEHKVLACEPSESFQQNGKWKVKVEDMKEGRQFEQQFDGIMVCTGHHVTPMWAQFPGQEKFKGKIMHTHSYKRPLGFENKRVCVVGVGNSGGDVAVELSMVSPNVYLSTRRGAWIVKRVGLWGKPFDAFMLTRSFNFMFNTLPMSITAWFYETLANHNFDHQLYKLKPEHRIFEQHVMVNDALPNRVLSGTVKLKNNIERITENGVIFEEDPEEYQCDVIILATGYKVHFPFIDEKLVPVTDNQLDLYKYVFPPNLGKFSHTLAFIGLVQSVGALLPIGEMQSRWYAQLMSGNGKLPESEQEMRREIEETRSRLECRYFKSPRNTMQVDWINYMDEMAQEIGCMPHVWSYFMSDWLLWFSLCFGPCVPYQYRLEGPHSWDGARDAIIEATERMKAPLNTRKLNNEQKTFTKKDNSNKGKRAQNGLSRTHQRKNS